MVYNQNDEKINGIFLSYSAYFFLIMTANLIRLLWKVNRVLSFELH